MVELGTQNHTTLLPGQSDDDPADVTANGKSFSGRNSRNIRQIAASSQIREVGEESGNLEMNPAFWELTGKTKGETWCIPPGD
jgi:hypothetical protein